MIESRRKMPHTPSRKASARSVKRQSGNEGDIVTLTWGGHSSTVSTFFYDLLEQGRFVDLRLACEGHIIDCHRIILAACSNYFEEMLSGQEDKMTILIAGVKFWELQALVIFMYKGEVIVRRDLIEDLLEAARALRVKGLRNVDHRRSLENATKKKLQPHPIVKFENHSYCMSSPTSGALMPQNYSANNGNGMELLKLENIKKEKIDDGEDSDNAHAPLLPSDVPNPAFVGSINLANVKTEPMQTDEENNDDELQNEKENTQMNGTGTGDTGIVDEGGKVEKNSFQGDCFSDAANGENETENRAHTPPVKLSSRMKYPADVREAAVKDMLNGMPLDECFLKYNVPKKTLSNWKSKRTHQLKHQKNKAKKSNDSPGPSLYTPPTRQRQQYINPYALPPVEGESREEHLKNAAKLVVHEVTNIKNAASHYGIPRTTLSNYMRRNGLMYLKKEACAYQSSGKDSDENLEMPEIHAMNLSISGYENMDVAKARNSDSQLLMA